jgi:hypothetical protein
MAVQMQNAECKNKMTDMQKREVVADKQGQE